MLLAWENDAEVRDEAAALYRRKKRFTKTWERVSRRINRRSFHVAVRTNAWHRPLAREELLPVTTETRLMFRILSHIRERITLAHVFPILRRERVT